MFGLHFSLTIVGRWIDLAFFAVYTSFVLLQCCILFQLFEGNTDSLHQTRNTFHPSIMARSIRVVPQQRHRIIAMRLQLLGCPYVKPIPGACLTRKGFTISFLSLELFTKPLFLPKQWIHHLRWHRRPGLHSPFTVTWPNQWPLSLILVWF